MIIFTKDCICKNNKNVTFYNDNHVTINYMVYIYAFIYKDEYYILVLDEIILPDPSDEWEGHFWYITSFDMSYINMCKNKKVFKFDWTWFLKEENSDELCENEMIKIRPIIRKNKIEKLLNVK